MFGAPEPLNGGRRALSGGDVRTALGWTFSVPYFHDIRSKGTNCLIGVKSAPVRFFACIFTNVL